jgi:hypothetical protein
MDRINWRTIIYILTLINLIMMYSGSNPTPITLLNISSSLATGLLVTNLFLFKD